MSKHYDLLQREEGNFDVPILMKHTLSCYSAEIQTEWKPGHCISLCGIVPDCNRLAMMIARAIRLNVY